MSKRLILLTIGILMLFCLSAMATETRVATMGNSGLYLKDDAGIFTYPGTMSMYKNMIIAEHISNSSSTDPTPFAYPSFRRVGIILPAWGTGTLAIFAGEGQESFEVGGGGPFIEPTTRFLVGYGMNTGNSSLGFQVDFSGVRDENPDPVPQGGTPTVFTASTWGFAVGLSTPMGELNNLDFGFRLRIGKFKNEIDTTAAGNVLEESDGNTSLSFVVRDYYAMNDYLNLVPVGALGISSQKDNVFAGFTPPDTAIELNKTNLTALEAGLALQTKPSENSEIIGGAGYRFAKERTKFFDNPSAGTPTSDEETSVTSLPFAFLGFEASVKNWMHFRLGVEKEIVTTKNKNNEPPTTGAPDRDESKDTDSPLSYAVGVGVHAGPVTMDAQVANDWWNAGPNFLSGDNFSGDMFPRITFTYLWK